MIINLLLFVIACIMLAPVLLFIITRIAWQGGHYFPSLRICVEIQDALPGIYKSIRNFKQQSRKNTPPITAVGILAAIAFLPLFLVNIFILAQVIEIYQPAGQQVFIPLLNTTTDILGLLWSASISGGMILFAYLSVKGMEIEKQDSTKHSFTLFSIIRAAGPLFWFSLIILTILLQAFGSFQRLWILIEQSGIAGNLSSTIIQMGYVFTSIFSAIIPIVMIKTGLIFLSDFLSPCLTKNYNYSIIIWKLTYYWILKILFVFHSPSAKKAFVIKNIRTMAGAGEVLSRISKDLPAIRNAVAAVSLPAPAEELMKLFADVRELKTEADSFLKEKKNVLEQLQNIDKLDEEWLKRHGLIDSAIDEIAKLSGSITADIKKIKSGIKKVFETDDNTIPLKAKNTEALINRHKAALIKYENEVVELSVINKGFSEIDFDLSGEDEISISLYKHEINKALEINKRIPVNIESLEKQIGEIREIMDEKIQVVDETLLSLKELASEAGRIKKETREVECLLRNIRSLIPCLKAIKRNMFRILALDIIRVLRTCILDLIDRTFRAASDILSILDNTINLFFDRIKLIMTGMKL